MVIILGLTTRSDNMKDKSEVILLEELSTFKVEIDEDWLRRERIKEDLMEKGLYWQYLANKFASKPRKKKLYTVSS